MTPHERRRYVRDQLRIRPQKESPIITQFLCISNLMYLELEYTLLLEENREFLSRGSSKGFLGYRRFSTF